MPCEIQLRTLLQHSWAEISHDDIYKEGAGLPEDLKGRNQDLSTVIAAADELASRIRKRVMEEKNVLPESVQENVMNKDGLAYIFTEVFGRGPREYALQQAYETCLDVSITTLDELREKLSNKDLRDTMIAAYKEEYPFGLNLSPEVIFSIIPVAVTKGDNAALMNVREIAQDEREGLENIWRNEILGDLPETFDEFMNELRDDEINVKQVAEALNVTDECFVCGETISHADSFLEAIANYYEEEGDYRLLGDIFGAADCWADENHPTLCPYHGAQVDKDD